MKNKLCALIIFLFMGVIGVSNNCWSQQDPIQMMDGIVNNMMVVLKKNQDEIDRDPTLVFGIIDEFVLPHIDFDEMAKWVAGKTVWGQASKGMQDSFIAEFKTLVVRTYASILGKYTDEKVIFSPFEPSDKQAKRIEISSKVLRSNKEDVMVKYRLVAYGDNWRVYDIIVEGVSILQGFRSQFSDQIKNKGLDMVTKQIKEHNNSKG